MRIPATRTSSNLAADDLILGITKVRIHDDTFHYLFRRIGKHSFSWNSSVDTDSGRQDVHLGNDAIFT